MLTSLGYAPEEFKEVSKDFFRKIVHPEDAWAIDHHIKKIKLSTRGEILSLNLRIQDKKGHFRWIHIRDTVVSRNEAGEVTRLIGSVADTSRYQHAKKKIDLHASRLDYLSYRNAHELRGPVASILGLVSLLKSQARTKECIEEIFDLLETTALKMDKVIREFDEELTSNREQLKSRTMEFQHVANNNYYTISVNREKNRAYLKIKGFWNKPESVPNYLADWKRALHLLNRNFTLLTDASEMKTHPQEVRLLHEQAQGLLVKSGVAKIAEIVKDDIAEIQLNAMAKKTLLPKRNFKVLKDAEDWLSEN